MALTDFPSEAELAKKVDRHLASPPAVHPVLATPLVEPVAVRERNTIAEVVRSVRRQEWLVHFPVFGVALVVIAALIGATAGWVIAARDPSTKPAEASQAIHADGGLIASAPSVAVSPPGLSLDSVPRVPAQIPRPAPSAAATETEHVASARVLKPLAVAPAPTERKNTIISTSVEPPAVTRELAIVTNAELPAPPTVQEVRPASTTRPAEERVEPSTPSAAVIAVPVPSPPAVAPAALAARPDDEPAIRRLLSEYQAAYERLDAAAAKQIWPRVDERALSRAFADLDSQSMAFASCKLAIGDGTALAYCHGSASYVGKRGSHNAQTQNRDWTFALRKKAAGWELENVTVR
jgi:hypothetical protein